MKIAVKTLEGSAGEDCIKIKQIITPVDIKGCHCVVNHIRKSQKLLFTQSGIEYSDTAPDLFSAPVMPCLANVEVERGEEEGRDLPTRLDFWALGNMGGICTFI